MNKQVRLLVPALLVLWFGRHLLTHLTDYGSGDWDQHLFYYGSFLKNLLEHKQLPFWNPWYCGGNVLWQNPQIPLISPVYVLALFLPLTVAMKFNILLHYYIALVGMNFLGAKLFKIRSFPLLLVGSSIFVFNGFFALQIAEGHTWIFAFAYIPFAFYFFHRSLCHNKLKDILYCAILLTLMVFSAGIYPVFYLVLFCGLYFLIRWIRNPSLRTIRSVLLLGLFFMGLSGIKVAPMMAFTKQHPRVSTHKEWVHPKSLEKVFVGRTQSIKKRRVIPEQQWNWHEYGCFVGYGLVVLLALALLYCFLRPTYLSLLSALGVFFFLVIYLGRFSEWAPYALWDHIPFVRSLRVPGRAMILWTFSAGLCLFYLLKRLEQFLFHRRGLFFVPTFLLLVLTADLFTVNSPIFLESVGIPASRVAPPKNKTFPPYQVVFDIGRYGASSSLYKAMLQNKSVWNCLEPQQAHRGHKLGYPLVFATKNATIQNIRFSPNVVTFDAQVKQKTTIYLNQNYAQGWKFSLPHTDVTMDRNLPTAQASKGEYKNVTFRFTPPYLKLTFGVFLLTLACIFFLLRRRHFKI